MKEKKTEIFVLVGCLLVIVLSVSLAWFSLEILGESKEVSVESTNLKIVFTSGSGTIKGTNIEPGWTSGVNTFTVKNESKETYKYNIIMKDLINTFVTDGFLVYKITSDDGGYNMSEFKDVPQSSDATNTVLAHSIEIGAGETHSYSIIVNYLNDESVDQSDDMGKELNGYIFIEKGSDNLYGNYKEGTLGWKILDDNPNRSSRSKFDTTYTTISTGRIYVATEKNIHNTEDTTVYYFAGNAKNNWVKFGQDSSGNEFYWRIIRTNADGSIRLLYSGTSPDTTSGYIKTSAFNSTNNDSMYVGYKYGTSGSLALNRTNDNDSTIKGAIDSWYANNLTDYTDYLSTTAVYCADRTVGSGAYTANESNVFYYAPRTRAGSFKPTYNCMEAKDAFSVENTEAQLTYPIALMTADEIMYAGGKLGTNLPSPYAWYYLNSNGSSITGGTWWWLLSPNHWSGSVACVLYVGGSSPPGYLYVSLVSNGGGVRPVVSVKSTVTISGGDGTANNPYTLNG